MEQAIIEIGPHFAKFRGVDGFWVGQVDINQVPRDSVMHLLGRVEQKNVEERERVVRFLMDVGWRAEAKQELDRLVKDFPTPDLKERTAIARQYLQQLDAEKRRSEIDVSRKAQQYQRVAELHQVIQRKRNSDPARGRGPRDRTARPPAAARRPGHGRRPAQAGRSTAVGRARVPGRSPLSEVLKAIETAPEAVRDRLAAWRKAMAQKAAAQAQFALAMSGFVAGHELAAPELKAAEVLWKARQLVRDYLSVRRAGRARRAAGPARRARLGCGGGLHRYDPSP